MKRYNRIALAALFLLAGAAAGLRAAAPGNGKVNLPPEYGTLVLPVISAEADGLITEARLTVSLVDGADKPEPHTETLRWTKAGWRNKKGEALSQLPFPLMRDAKFATDPKFRYKLKYAIIHRSGDHYIDMAEHLPIAGDGDFSVTASFPFEVVRISAENLDWSALSSGTGLRTVSWAIKRGTAAKVKKEGGAFGPKASQEAGLLVHKKEMLTADIAFNCVSGTGISQVKWADNGKDLRKLPSGLNIVLTQPDCPK
jgi:hypothetical protein